ncbi:hypothetical protein [Laspinema olomoucense]|nr:hypothetical protein [Laspinema sp. D3c]
MMQPDLYRKTTAENPTYTTDSGFLNLRSPQVSTPPLNPAPKRL